MAKPPFYDPQTEVVTAKYLCYNENNYSERKKWTAVMEKRDIIKYTGYVAAFFLWLALPGVLYFPSNVSRWYYGVSCVVYLCYRWNVKRKAKVRFIDEVEEGEEELTSQQAKELAHMYMEEPGTIIQQMYKAMGEGVLKSGYTAWKGKTNHGKGKFLVSWTDSGLLFEWINGRKELVLMDEPKEALNNNKRGFLVSERSVEKVQLAAGLGDQLHLRVLMKDGSCWKLKNVGVMNWRQVEEFLEKDGRLAVENLISQKVRDSRDEKQKETRQVAQEMDTATLNLRGRLRKRAALLNKVALAAAVSGTLSAIVLQPGVGSACALFFTFIGVYHYVNYQEHVQIAGTNTRGKIDFSLCAVSPVLVGILLPFIVWDRGLRPHQKLFCLQASLVVGAVLAGIMLVLCRKRQVKLSGQLFCVGLMVVWAFALMGNIVVCLYVNGWR